jgi:hypothetical protein
MTSDLSESQKEEMSRFFWEELHGDYWMRALSPKDVDATWNIRPDHSWLGAYAAGPPATAKGLYKIDRPERVAAWVKNLAKAGNQGPIGQAHFVETVFPLEDGAAYKCPNDPPYINDWCCIAGGGFTDLVIDTIFGCGSEASRRPERSAEVAGLRRECSACKSAASRQEIHDFPSRGRCHTLTFDSAGLEFTSEGTCCRYRRYACQLWPGGKRSHFDA